MMHILQLAAILKCVEASSSTSARRSLLGTVYCNSTRLGKNCDGCSAVPNESCVASNGQGICGRGACAVNCTESILGVKCSPSVCILDAHCVTISGQHGVCDRSGNCNIINCVEQTVGMKCALCANREGDKCSTSDHRNGVCGTEDRCIVDCTSVAFSHNCPGEDTTMCPASKKCKASEGEGLCSDNGRACEGISWWTQTNIILICFGVIALIFVGMIIFCCVLKKKMNETQMSPKGRDFNKDLERKFAGMQADEDQDQDQDDDADEDEVDPTLRHDYTKALSVIREADSQIDALTRRSAATSPSPFLDLAEERDEKRSVSGALNVVEEENTTVSTTITSRAESFGVSVPSLPSHAQSTSTAFRLAGIRTVKTNEALVGDKGIDNTFASAVVADNSGGAETPKKERKPGPRSPRPRPDAPDRGQDKGHENGSTASAGKDGDGRSPRRKERRPGESTQNKHQPSAPEQGPMLGITPRQKSRPLPPTPDGESRTNDEASSLASGARKHEGEGSPARRKQRPKDKPRVQLEPIA
eukprot:GEMP01013510.1.p1 GENE.GEMP01013510.1~~GEMP01013510.1.p1  ORF type:complete len:531 (+),score=95.83 GEMP01013510.1:254-1846(+)